MKHFQRCFQCGKRITADSPICVFEDALTVPYHPDCLLSTVRAKNGASHTNISIHTFLRTKLSSMHWSGRSVLALLRLLADSEGHIRVEPGGEGTLETLAQLLGERGGFTNLIIILKWMRDSGYLLLDEEKRTIQVPPARPGDGGQLEYWPSDWPPAENSK